MKSNQYGGPRRSFRHLTTVCLGVVALIWLLAGCNKQPQKNYYKETGTRFHTVYHVVYEHTESLSSAIDSAMSAFNASLNPFDSTTLISKINRNETDSIDHMLAEVLLAAQEVSRATGGVYDVTGAPFFNIWGFGTKKGVTREATPAEIDSIKAFVGYKMLTIDTVTMRLTKADKRLTIIPSSLSKGYITDLVGKTLEAHGVTNYMVEIGGEIACKGVNPMGDCWQVGINKPVEDSTSTVNELMYKVEICTPKGLASSGDYRNYKVYNGKKVAHTIDVLTGYPAHADILSATVLTDKSMMADAWATAFMAMGLEKSKAVLEQHPELKVIFIYHDESTGSLAEYNNGLEVKAIGQQH